MKYKAIVIPIVILIVGFVVMQVLMSFKSDPPRRAPAPRSKIVESEVVTLRDISSQVTAFGRVASAQPVILYSEVAGELMPGKVPFQPAQAFKQGDLLLRIDDRPIKLDLNSTKSDLLNALASVLPEIRVDFPEEYETWQNYFNECGFDKELPPLPEVANQKIKLFLSRFNVYKLYFAVRDLEILLEKHYFVAPFDGSIISADLRVGSTARNGTRLGEIINLESMEVEVPIPSHDIDWIDQSKPAVLTSSEITGQWQGSIKRIGKSIDTRTQTIPVFISVNHSNSARLFNGIFLNAEIPGRVIKNAATIPRRALYDNHFVYIINDGKLSFQRVEVARQETDTIIINGGLQNGDTLVVEVLQGVAPGMLAQPRFVEPQIGSE